MAALTTSQAARPFPTAGSSYTANVAFRLDKKALLLGSVQGTISNCAVQGGAASNVIDYSMGTWALMNMTNANSTATVRVTLDRVYTLNKIVTQYSSALGVPPGEYQICLSLDAISWTTNVARKPITALTHADSFTAADARYIEWRVWGPGVDLAGVKYTYMTELMAFVASGAATIPLKDDSYSIVHTATLSSKSGWISWAQPEYLMDNDVLSYAIASPPGVAVFDLGGLYQLYHIRCPFYPGQNWANGGQVEISRDQASWTTVAVGTPFGGGNFTFDPQYARYIRVSGDGNGALLEIEAFALPPAAGTVIVLK